MARRCATVFLDVGPGASRPSFRKLEESRVIEVPDRFAVQAEALRLLFMILRLILLHKSFLFHLSWTGMVQRNP